jgi:hypothetical protein
MKISIHEISKKISAKKSPKKSRQSGGLTALGSCAILYKYTGRGGLMTVPNWQHHSNKEQKRHLKPQALRDARKRRQALKNRLTATGRI